MDLFSFNAANYVPGQGGVVKLGNIPYSITKDEVIHYMGRAPGILQRPSECGIHIIMERPTAKTMDCYVEFRTQEEAVAFVRKHEYENHGKKRLGNRQVYVDLVDQEELLRELWPRSKCIVWSNGNPHRVENEDEYSTGFQGFFTTEEMVGIVRAAENPQRSPFSQKCIQRTYECMVSSLFKFPWQIPSLYTLGDRNALFTAYSAQLTTLLKKVTQHQIVNLDHKLLTDFVNAGMLCAGFSQRQKAFILLSCTLAGLHQWPPHPTAEAWPFDVICWHIGADQKYVEYVIARLHLGTEILRTHDRARIPRCIEVTSNPNPPYNLLFNFEPSPTTQSVNFETAFYLELNFAREILAAVDQYEATMGGIGLPMPLEIGSEPNMQQLMGLPEILGEGGGEKGKGRESPGGTTVLYDSTTNQNHNHQHNNVNGHGTVMQNNYMNGYSDYTGGHGVGFGPPVPTYPTAPVFGGSSGPQNYTSSYGYGQGSSYGPPQGTDAVPVDTLTSPPTQIKPTAAPVAKKVNPSVKTQPIGTAGPNAFPRPSTTAVTQNELTPPIKASPVSTTPTSTSIQAPSSDAATPRAKPAVTTAEAAHQRRTSFEFLAPASTTKPANLSVSTPLSTTVGVGPTIWSPTSIAQAEWKMPDASGFSSPTKTTTSSTINPTSLTTSRRISGNGNGITFGTISAGTGLEDSPTIGKGKLGRQGRDLSRDSSRESLAMMMKSMASSNSSSSAATQGESWEGRGAGNGGIARRTSLATARSSSKPMHRSSIVEEPEELESPNIIGEDREGLGARLVGGGFGSGGAAGPEAGQTRAQFQTPMGKMTIGGARGETA